MKLVIDIPEEDYKRMKEQSMFGRADVWRKAIQNGTPLQKGHGRLIDVSDIEPMSYTVDGGDYYDNYKAIDWEDIENAPTIIEADKAESEDKT